MKKTIDVINQTVTFTFEGGLAPVVFHANTVKSETATHAMMHGFSQKIGDNAAIQKSEENNFRVTEEMRRHAVEDMIEQLVTEGWNAKRTAKAAPQNPVILAIAAKLGVTYEAAQAKVAAQFLEELGAE